MTATPAEAPPSFDLATLKAMLQDTVREETAALKDELSTLRQRITANEIATPRLLPPIKAERTGGDYRQTLADSLAEMTRPGDERSIDKGHIPMLANGRVLPQTVLDMLTPQFDTGQVIRLNPDIVRVPAREGTPQMVAPDGSIIPAKMGAPPRTWGDICRAHGVSGVGRVVKRYDVLTPNGWSYRVHIDGLSSKNDESLTEDQLLAVG